MDTPTDAAADTERAADDIPARLVDLARRMPHLVGISDGDGRLRWLNEAGHRFVGSQGRTELTTVDLFADDVIDRYYATIRPALVRDGVWTGELRVRRAGRMVA